MPHKPLSAADLTTLSLRILCFALDVWFEKRFKTNGSLQTLSCFENMWNLWSAVIASKLENDSLHLEPFDRDKVLAYESVKDVDTFIYIYYLTVSDILLYYISFT